MPDLLLHLPQALRDAAYNNTAAVADAASQLDGFERRSNALAANAPGQLDIAFGAAERLRFDYFQGRTDLPTLLFIHGGYWQMRHKNTFRFVVEGALERGLNAALIGYTLAPQASLTRIVQEVRQGVAAVRTHARRLGGSGRILLCGWSAGGHLAAIGLDCDGVVAGLGISGIYDLAPLQHTYLNQALQLTALEVATLSPLHTPLVAKPFLIAYGTAELPQLQAQSLAFADYRRGLPGGAHAVDRANHFSILNALASPAGPLLERFMAILEAIVPDGA